MAYTKIGGVAFTGQEVEVNSRENRVALTQGERAKTEAEAPWDNAVILERCGATSDGNNSCYYPAGHSRKGHSWKHSSTDSA
jgi:hypothetical protein